MQKLLHYLDLCCGMERCKEEKAKIVRGVNSGVSYLTRQLAHLQGQLDRLGTGALGSVDSGMQLETARLYDLVAKHLRSMQAAHTFIIGEAPLAAGVIAWSLRNAFCNIVQKFCRIGRFRRFSSR